NRSGLDQGCRLRPPRRSRTTGTLLRIAASFSLSSTPCSFATSCCFDASMCCPMPFNKSGFVQLAWGGIVVDKAIELEISRDISDARHQGHDKQQDGRE